MPHFQGDPIDYGRCDLQIVRGRPSAVFSQNFLCRSAGGRLLPECEICFRVSAEVQDTTRTLKRHRVKAGFAGLRARWNSSQIRDTEAARPRPGPGSWTLRSRTRMNLRRVKRQLAAAPKFADWLPSFPRGKGSQLQLSRATTWIGTGN